MIAPENGNGHLTKVLAAKLEALSQLMDERDRRYGDRSKGQDAAVGAAFAASEGALQLRSAETERRLELLNGEAARLALVLAQSVPREVWEESQKTADTWKATVDKQLNTSYGRRELAVYVVGLVIVGVQIALSILRP